MAPAFPLKSPETGTEYQISIAPSAENPAAKEPPPAVIVLDADDQFPFAVDAYEALRRMERVPPLLLVGVGYGGSYQDPVNRRGRDYTPTQTADEPESGGADAFLAFVTDTLWPEIRRRHEVSDRDRGIAGHSVGALLVLHALFQRRPFFTRHLASAPSIWWDHRAILCRAQRLRREQDDLPARLFLCIGENDTESMRGDLAMLEEQLADDPFHRCETQSVRFPGRTHYDVLPDAYRAGLAALFGSG